MSIQAIGAAIVWLSGAVAGLGAIFCTFGYIAALSHAHILGVEFRSLRYDYPSYVQYGAVFFVSLIQETALRLFLVLALVLGVLFACRGGRWLCRKLAIKAPFRWVARHHLDWRGIAYVALVILLALQLSDHLQDPEWIDISNILQSAAQKPSAADSVREAILSGNRDLLLDQFSYHATQQVWIVAMLLLAWFVSRDRSWAMLRTAPFAIVLVTSLVFLAREYGVLVRPITFREALIKDETPPTKWFLLNELQNGYVFWDCSQQRARWIPLDRDKSLVFSRGRRTLGEILQSCDGAGR